MDDRIQIAATEFADQTDTDVLVYSGVIERGYDDKLLDLLAKMKRREHVLLLLCSNGGNPDAAYRMARGLQNSYKNFTVLLAGRCKSAGTLMVLGATEVIMTDHAELGPLDVQLGKKDELFELDSGLTVLNALTEIESKAFELFEKTMFRIKVGSSGNVTFKTATQVAVELAKGVVAPVMAQIDPMHVGEVSRALKIGKEYGARLSEVSGNLNEGMLDRLVEQYPSHGFVIDRREAKEIFVAVRGVKPEEAVLIEMPPLHACIRRPGMDGAILMFLSEARKEAAHDASNAQNTDTGKSAVAQGIEGDERILGDQEPPRSGTVTEQLLSRKRTGTE